MITMTNYWVIDRSIIQTRTGWMASCCICFWFLMWESSFYLSAC